MDPLNQQSQPTPQGGMPAPEPQDAAQAAGFVRPVNVQPLTAQMPQQAASIPQQQTPMAGQQVFAQPPRPDMMIPRAEANVVVPPPKQRSSLMMTLGIIGVVLLLGIGGLYAYGSYIQSQQPAEAPHEGFQVTERQIDTPNFDGYESQNTGSVDDILNADEPMDDMEIPMDAPVGEYVE